MERRTTLAVRAVVVALVLISLASVVFYFRDLAASPFAPDDWLGGEGKPGEASGRFSDDSSDLPPERIEVTGVDEGKAGLEFELESGADLTLRVGATDDGSPTPRPYMFDGNTLYVDPPSLREGYALNRLEPGGQGAWGQWRVQSFRDGQSSDTLPPVDGNRLSLGIFTDSKGDRSHVRTSVAWDLDSKPDFPITENAVLWSELLEATDAELDWSSVAERFRKSADFRKLVREISSDRLADKGNEPWTRAELAEAGLIVKGGITHDSESIQIHYELEKWTSPLFELEVAPDVPLDSESMRVQIPPSQEIEIYRRTEPADPEIWRNKSVDALVKHEEDMSVLRKLLERFLMKEDLEDDAFLAYPGLLAFQHYKDGEEGSETQKDRLVEYFEGMVGLSKLDAGRRRQGNLADDANFLTELSDRLTEGQSYHLTYSYCYFTLNCLLTLELIPRARSLKAPEEWREDISELETQLWRGLDVALTNLCDQVTGTKDVGLPLGSGGKDRSCAILVAYALWKVDAAFKSPIPPSKSEDLGNALVRVPVAMTNMANYITEEDALRLNGDSDGNLSLHAITYNEKNSVKKHLFGGFLMAKLLDPDERLALKSGGQRAEDWARYLSADQVEWLSWERPKDSTVNDWHYWYRLVYFCRMFEVYSATVTEVQGEAAESVRSRMTMVEGHLRSVLDLERLASLVDDEHLNKKQRRRAITFFLIAMETLQGIY